MDMTSYSSGSLLRRLAATHTDGSFSNTRRSQRFAAFEKLFDELPKSDERPARILDIGGTNSFLELRGWAGRPDVQIVLVNIEAEPVEHANIEPRVGDATNLSEFPDGSFDVVFSNSVIEHLETSSGRRRWRRRCGGWRRSTGCRRRTSGSRSAALPDAGLALAAGHGSRRHAAAASLGWRGPCPDPVEATELVREVRLMRGGELRRMFPAAALRRERIGPFVKSFVAVGS